MLQFMWIRYAYACWSGLEAPGNVWRGCEVSVELHWRQSRAFGGHVLAAEVTYAANFFDMECFELRSQAMFETRCSVL